MTTVTIYNHTARRFMDGSNAADNVYKLVLYSSAIFNAADTTLAGITGTELPTANGYTSGGQALANVTATTVTTNDAMFDADDMTWNASGGPITASFAVLYNATDTGSPPLAFIDFEAVKTADDGAPFIVTWAAGGIMTLAVT